MKKTPNPIQGADFPPEELTIQALDHSFETELQSFENWRAIHNIINYKTMKIKTIIITLKCI